MMSQRIYYADDYEQEIRRIAHLYDYQHPLNCALMCSASMAVERMLNLSFPPDLCTRLAIRCGVMDSREGVMILAGAIAERFSLKMNVCHLEEAVSRVESGARAIIYYAAQTPENIRYYMMDHVEQGLIFAISPCISQMKGVQRGRRRLIKMKDHYILIPIKAYQELYPEETLFMVYSTL